MSKNTGKDSRRNFLFQSGKSLAVLASANVGVYVIGAAFKKMDGGLVAGAKCATPGICPGDATLCCPCVFMGGNPPWVCQ